MVSTGKPRATTGEIRHPNSRKHLGMILYQADHEVTGSRIDSNARSFRWLEWAITVPNILEIQKLGGNQWDGTGKIPPFFIPWEIKGPLVEKGFCYVNMNPKEWFWKIIPFGTTASWAGRKLKLPFQIVKYPTSIILHFSGIFPRELKYRMMLVFSLVPANLWFHITNFLGL
jgi:hypothetical protein